MNRKGIGVGSASLVLTFTVLCLVIFTIISYTTAGNETALAQAEAELVKGYYDADALAVQVYNELVAADTIPASVHDVNIYTEWDEDSATHIAEYSCAVTQQMELYVKIAFDGDGHSILAWQLRNTTPWENDTSMPVWFSGGFERE